MYWPLRTKHPSQKEIFSFILASSYLLAFHYHNTLPKRNIFCYCSLIVCIGLWGPQTPLPKWNIFCYCSFIVCIGLSLPTTPSQSEIFSVIVAWSYVLAFQDHNIFPKWNIFCYCSLWLYVLALEDQTPSQSEIFSVIVAWLYVLAFQDHNTPPKEVIIFSVIVALS